MAASRFSLLTADDLYLFNEGSHLRLYDKLGAHPVTVEGRPGTFFAVWAPDAERVSVVGDFNGWDGGRHRLDPEGSSGIWSGFLPGIGHGAIYKYRIGSRYHGYEADKADPFAFHAELRPRTASIVWDLVGHDWRDGDWLAARPRRQGLDAPMSIYELHLGSWRRDADGGWLGYREVGPLLVAHLQRTGFTHVELMPIMEHPFDGSWGYQVTGYFAATSRFGTPQDLMWLIDLLHQNGFGVLLDWVPSHFPTDLHGLGYFDGTHLYEHADPRRGFHPDWGSLIFNYGRPEVRSFLLSSALFWLDRYHADGLRVDAVASMLYLDYSRKEGEWIPNPHGGREDLEAIAFLRRLNEEAYRHHPGVEMIAEESTSWPMVSRPTWLGGLGFGLKWDMGWMNDTLRYIRREPVHRSYHHGDLTFRMLYAWNENFLLPLSHDEVVHGKGSLVGKMPGDDWQKFANLRLLLAWQWAQPGRKLLFMGGEWGQWAEWDHDRSLDWGQLSWPPHAGLLDLVGDLNRLYRGLGALHQRDHEPQGFEWVDASDAAAGVLSFLRFGREPDDLLLAVFHFTPLVRRGYRLGVPRGGAWREVLNTDSSRYWGSDVGNLGVVGADPEPAHGRAASLALTIPPLGAIFLRPA